MSFTTRKAWRMTLVPIGHSTSRSASHSSLLIHSSRFFSHVGNSDERTRYASSPAILDSIAMISPVESSVFPSCFSALAWSPDGELAVAGGDQVYILVCTTNICTEHGC